MDPLDVAPLGGDPGSLVRQVDVADVETQDLGGPPSRFVQQAPQRLLPEIDVPSAPEDLELGAGNCLGLVLAHPPMFDRLRWIAHHPALPAPDRLEGLDGRELPVPGGGGDARGCLVEYELQGIGVES